MAGDTGDAVQTDDAAEAVDAPGSRRGGMLWLIPIGILALALFGAAIGVVVDGNSSKSASSKPETQVLGQTFSRETSPTVTQPPRTGSTTATTTATTVTPAPVTATTTATTTRITTAPSTATTVRTPTTTATLPPRPECGSGSPRAVADITVRGVVTQTETTAPPTSIVGPGIGSAVSAIQYWVVTGNVVVSSSVSKAIVIDGLTVKLVRLDGSTQDVALGGVAGTTLEPGTSKPFPVNVQSDIQPTAVDISHLAYHVAGIPACAVA